MTIVMIIAAPPLLGRSVLAHPVGCADAAAPPSVIPGSSPTSINNRRRVTSYGQTFGLICGVGRAGLEPATEGL
jgi:hypothetical protein